jgi:hypothetical protein
MPPLSYSTLKAKHRRQRDDWSQDVSLRVHRALSWLERAEKETADPDAAFIFLWISFNSAYAREIKQEEIAGEQMRYDSFIRRLVATDRRKRIHEVLFDTYSHALENLIENKFVLPEYWQHCAAPAAGIDWSAALEDGKRKAHGAVKHADVYTYLRLVLARLYVLRNQLIHGSATWGGETNRAQVQDAAQILRSFVPIMIDIIMDDPDQEWGEPLYPVQY